MIHKIRGAVLPGLLALAALLGLLGLISPGFWWGLVVPLPLLLLGLYDVMQTEHSILRNYPLLGHLRFLLEDFGPELHQYFVETNKSGAPFNRDARSIMYQRAKGLVDKKPFGTEEDVYAPGYTWISHSIAPKAPLENPVEALRVDVGAERCAQPYSASVLNISAMSFGSLGANAILAMNAGARRGNFAHNTGEGGVSRHHKQNGGDLIWQIGTGYFGCRTAEGRFDLDLFTAQARDPQVKMIEVKLSQGAKPGHGGILPAAKVSPEIAEARGVPVGEDCISPTYHTAFSTPRGLLEFVAKLREASGGKPVGFKLCIGDPTEFLCVCKAMIETGLLPDFVTVDGAEGGTGAAPLEFSDHLGMPLQDGLLLVQNALIGIGVRDRLCVAASGKTTTAFMMAGPMAIGADWCNTARGFMFSVGCIQSQKCHTNQCPVGVTTQNPRLGRALVVQDKSERAYHFHKNTVKTLADFIAAAGLEHTRELGPHHVWQRVTASQIERFDRLYDFLEPGQLLDGSGDPRMQSYWDAARAESFRPA